TETTVLQGALAALATVQKGYPAEHRWRFNLAVKQGIEAKQLVELSVHPEALVADPARDILMRLAMMPTNLRAEFEAGDRSVRDESLANLDRVRSSRPSGPYMAMLY